MPEVEIAGVNPINFPHLATWHWHVALYLFVGGLVAGLMIFSAAFRLTKRQGLSRALLVTDLVGLPILAIGMFLLWLDLSQPWNAWRFFTTFKLSSPMSWGSWILLVSMGLLGLRLLTHLPEPAALAPTGRFGRAVYALWRFGVRLGQLAHRWSKGLDVLALLFGIGLGLYTGVLLNTIPARPLWDSSLLPLLFLASGIASGCAFLCLFITAEQTRRLVPLSISIAVVELVLIIGYLLTLTGGSEATWRASGLLFSEAYGLGLWGGVVALGLLIPVGLETIELTRRHLPRLLTRLAPVLTLGGGLTLRFVVVYAGLQSFI